MKEILIIGTYPPPYGGISTIISNLIPYLKEKGYNVHVFAPGYPGGNVDEDNLKVYKPDNKNLILKGPLFCSSLLKIIGIKHQYGINGMSLKRTIRMALWVDYLRSAVFNKNKIDIICTFHLFDRGLLGAFLSEVYNIPLVTVNFGEIYAEQDFYKRNISAVSFIISQSNKLVSVSQHCASSYKLLKLGPKIEIIFSSVDKSRFNTHVRGDDVRKSFTMGKKDSLVLFIGRMIRDMGLDTLIDAVHILMKKTGSIKFLIGGAEGELTESVKTLADCYPLNVFYATNISPSELPYYYAASSVVVVPTKDDRSCMGLAMKEAMLCGKAVIGSKVGGIPEAITHNENGLLIEPDNAEELAEAILYLENNPDLRFVMAKKGEGRALSCFVTEIANKKWLGIFDELVEKERSRA